MSPHQELKPPKVQEMSTQPQAWVPQVLQNLPEYVHPSVNSE